MPPTTGIAIELDSAVKAFFPGQTITGRVLIDAEKSIESKGLTIRFEGKVKVNWSERFARKEGNQSRRFVSIFYTAEESYFQHETLLLGDANERSNTIIVGRGRSLYEFQYTLPNNLPSSFVSRFGTVSYVMEASLLLPHNRSDATSIVPFTVNGILDLNVEPGANLALETRKYKSLYCFCCTSGPVGFVFKLPRRGFVPGEVLDFTVELSNQSSQRIYGMKVTLMQTVKFHAERNSKVIMRPIRQLRGPEVDAGETEVWIEKMLRIPPIPPTRLAGCQIIEVEYTLKVEMTLPNISVNLKDEIPVIIGTIPLRDTFETLNPSSTALSPTPTAPLKESSSEPSPLSSDHSPNNNGNGGGDWDSKSFGLTGRQRGLSVSSDPPSFLDYPNLPPPTYQEAIMLDKHYDGSEDNRGFSLEELSAGPSRTRSNSSNQTQYANTPASTGDVSNFVPQYITYGGAMKVGNNEHTHL